MDNNTFAIKALIGSLERAIEEGNMDVVRTISEEILRATGGTPAPEKEDIAHKIERLNRLFEEPRNVRLDIVKRISDELGADILEVQYNKSGRAPNGIYWMIEYGHDGYTARFF